MFKLCYLLENQGCGYRKAIVRTSERKRVSYSKPMILRRWFGESWEFSKLLWAAYVVKIIFIIILRLSFSLLFFNGIEWSFSKVTYHVITSLPDV